MKKLFAKIYNSEIDAVLEIKEFQQDFVIFYLDSDNKETIKVKEKHVTSFYDEEGDTFKSMAEKCFKQFTIEKYNGKLENFELSSAKPTENVVETIIINKLHRLVIRIKPKFIDGEFKQTLHISFLKTLKSKLYIINNEFFLLPLLVYIESGIVVEMCEKQSQINEIPTDTN